MFGIRSRGLLAVIAGLAALGGGLARAQSAVPESQLETFLGLQQGDLTGLNNGPVMNGSAIEQTITVPAGATLSFNYAFLTNEPVTSPLAAVNPFAFVTSPSLVDFADTFSPLVSSPPPIPFGRWTGYDSFSETFATAGTYTLGIGVANVTDNMFSSGLLLDNFKLSADSIANGSFETGAFTGWSTIGNDGVLTSFYGNSPPDGKYQAFLSTASVPEPSSVVLLTLGGLCAVAMAGVRGNRKKATSPSGA